MRLWCEKTGVINPNDEEYEPEDREHLEWGHAQEPVIADWYERKMGVKLQLGGPVYDGAHWATLDRTVIGANKLVEIKNVGSPHLYQHWDTSNPDGIPRYVRAQATIALDYHGARECDVVASIGGRPPHTWTVWYDSELAALLKAGRDRFWSLVQTHTAPALDHTPASKLYLLDKFPRDEERSLVDADEETDRLGAERVAAYLAGKRAETIIGRLDAEIMARIGANAGMRGNGWSMTWKIGADGKRRQRFTARGER
jgi:predicted phage-related endonuclease